jgi:putative ABC transport system substrate-binding protein
VAASPYLPSVDIRRLIVVALAAGILAAPLVGETQRAEQIHRIGYLSPFAGSATDIDPFRQGLHENGYVEGRNLTIEWRFAEGMRDRLPELAAGLVRLKIDIIVAVAPAAAIAAKNATTVIPIVFTLVSEPVGSGLVASLAQPGGNITGLSSVHGALTAKRLELLKEAVPSLKSILLLANPANPGSPAFVREARTAAGTLGVELRLVEARHLTDVEAAFTAIAPRARRCRRRCVTTRRALLDEPSADR